MTRYARGCLCCLLLAAQCGCSHLAPWSTLPSWYLPPASAASLLRYHAALDGLAPEAERNELQHAQQAFASRPHLSNRLRLALLLSRPASPSYDPDSALELLRSGAAYDEPSSLENLRALLVTLNVQQLGQAETLREESAQTIDQLRRRVQYLSRREAIAQRQLSEERQRLATLRRQLSELREIEQTLGERRKAMLLQLTAPDE